MDVRASASLRQRTLAIGFLLPLQRFRARVVMRAGAAADAPGALSANLTLAVQLLEKFQEQFVNLINAFFRWGMPDAG